MSKNNYVGLLYTNHNFIKSDKSNKSKYINQDNLNKLLISYIFNFDERLLDIKLKNLAEKRDETLRKSLSIFSNYNTNYSLIDFNGNNINYKTPLNNKLESELNKKLLPNILYSALDTIVVTDSKKLYDELIYDKEYEISESSKIEIWIDKNITFYGDQYTEYFNQYLFYDIVAYRHNGYLHLVRAGLKDKIVSEINYDELIKRLEKDFSNNSNNDKINKENNDKIIKTFSQEYFICLQVKPEYLLKILLRLISIWYLNKDLIKCIRKIKILINTFRARNDVEENKIYGQIPVIMIYLHPGYYHAISALKTLNYYMTEYVDIYSMKNSSPDYFIKYNDMIYYSNGNPELKRYLKVTGLENKINFYGKNNALFKYGIELIQHNLNKLDEKYHDMLKYDNKSKIDNL